MTERIGPSIDPGAPEIPPGLARDLRALFGKTPSVPPFVDQRVLAEVQRRMAAQRRRRFVLRVASIGTAAACVVGGVWLAASGGRPERETGSPDRIPAFVRADHHDLNADGRVDILDALTLARRIEIPGEPRPSALQPSNATTIVARANERGRPGSEFWDINGDGVIDRRDVDAVARQAVSLTN